MYKLENTVCRCMLNKNLLEFHLSIFFFLKIVYLFVLHFGRLAPNNGYLLFYFWWLLLFLFL